LTLEISRIGAEL